MKRVIKIKNGNNVKKYVLKEEYRDFGIYQEKCDCFVSGEYLLYNIENDITIIFASYNNLLYEELLDSIDSYHDDGKFDFKVMTTKEEKMFRYDKTGYNLWK